MNSPTREAYGRALVALGLANHKVVVLDADLARSTKSIMFEEIFPSRFFDMGISEADMIGTAAGLSACGMVPFASSFSVFATGRAFEQIRNSVCNPKLNVKIVGSNAGPSCGEDGSSHQSVEDIAIMRSLPNMTVVVPSDDIEAFAATIALADHDGPAYLRLGRMSTPTYHDESYDFSLYEAEILRIGDDISIVACGIMVARALEAADVLANYGVEAQVVNVHTIKPLDARTLESCARKTGRMVTVEEGSIVDGLGSAVCEVLAERYPIPVKRIGVPDVFGTSGEAEMVLEKFGLVSQAVVQECLSLLKQKILSSQRIASEDPLRLSESSVI